MYLIKNIVLVAILSCFLILFLGPSSFKAQANKQTESASSKTQTTSKQTESASFKVDSNIKEQKINHRVAKRSQKNISLLAKKTQSLVNRHRIVLEKIANAKIYNKQLKDLIKSQKKEMLTIKKNIKSLKRTNKDIIPLMFRMINSLKQFIKLDLPFLPKERSNRVKQLELIMKRADVSNAEKYRRLLNAYQIENEYARSIEAYKSEFIIFSQKRLVNFLRIGRIALFYQSIDASFSGMWDVKNKKWIKLSSTFSNSIRDGIRMAKKQKTPSLLKLPIQTATKGL